MSTTTPKLWVLTGANGAGKTTFYETLLAPRGVVFINADILARKISPDAPEEASYEAAKLAAQLRDSFLEKGESFCAETVFSHPSKIDLIAKAKGLGYEVTLFYIHLDSIELNLVRVAQRVTGGGHSVPEEKVRSRLPRTMRHIRQALPLVDQAVLLDNSFSDEPFQRVADLNRGNLSIHPATIPDWAREILVDYCG